MDARAMMADQLEDSGFQLKKALEGMPEEAMDFRATPNAMTPREQVAHLCECYMAMLTISDGKEHEWGSYKPSDLATGPLVAELFELRGQAGSRAVRGDDNALQHGLDYIVAHDYYHVGQICLARLACQPDWNAYSIYRHAQPEPV